MKQSLFLTLFVSLVLITGCTTAPTANTNTTATTNVVNTNDTVDEPAVERTVLTSDFEPTEGAEEGPGNYGPWNTRLLIATSEDGLTFTRSNTVITDQGDVPDLVMDATGRLYLYYTGWTVGDRDNATVVAISDDQGDTWIFKYLVLDGFENMIAPVDPDVQILENGTFRLFITSDPKDGEGAGTFYAESTDGIHFTKLGEAYRPGNKQNALDPSTVVVDDTWHLFNGGGPDGNSHATSSDGTAFTFYETDDYRVAGQPYMMANAIPTADGVRMYAFSNLAKDIRSFTSSDGYTWIADEGARLEPDTTSGLESDFVKDPAVVQLEDGSYFMVYVTAIP